MSEELVKITTELIAKRGVSCKVPNKRALIRLLHDIGTACGAKPRDVEELVRYYESRRQRDYTLRRLWGLRGAIRDAASLAGWGDSRTKPSSWASSLRFRARRVDGAVSIEGLRHKDLPYADMARLAGHVNTVPPIEHVAVAVQLPQLRYGWDTDGVDRVALPLGAMMSVLKWLMVEPCAESSREEKAAHYISEYGYDPYHPRQLEEPETIDEDVTPLLWLEHCRALGEFIRRRFEYGGGREIKFAEYVVEYPRPKHTCLAGNTASMELLLVHPENPNITVLSPPEISHEEWGFDGQGYLQLTPADDMHWNSADDQDTAVLKLNFKFDAALSNDPGQPSRVRKFAEEFATVVRSQFDSALQAMQNQPAND